MVGRGGVCCPLVNEAIRFRSNTKVGGVLIRAFVNMARCIFSKLHYVYRSMERGQIVEHLFIAPTSALADLYNL